MKPPAIIVGGKHVIVCAPAEDFAYEHPGPPDYGRLSIVHTAWPSGTTRIGAPLKINDVLAGEVVSFDADKQEVVVALNKDGAALVTRHFTPVPAPGFSVHKDPPR